MRWDLDPIAAAVERSRSAAGNLHARSEHEFWAGDRGKLMVWDELGYTGYIDLVQENKP